AIIAVAAAALMRRPMLVPNPLPQAANIVLGISLGAAVTPDTINHMSSWPAGLFILALAMAGSSFAVVVCLHRVHGWDTLSALFASSPGGLAQSLALAADMGCDLRAVAMVQAVRVLVLTAGLPLVLAGFGVSGGRPPGAPIMSIASFEELAVLIVAATVGGVLSYRLRVPGGLLVGAMAVSGVLHGIGLVKVTLPQPLAIAAFIVMGSIIGARFAGTDIWLLRRLTIVGL